MEPAAAEPSDRESPPNRAVRALVPARFLDLTADTLGELVATWGEPAYRTEQILDWVYRRRVDRFDEMTNLSKSLRTRLRDGLRVFSSTVAASVRSHDGTEKLLLRWPDGATSECVLIPDGHRRTACVSTQVGCPVGCRFCASGLSGLARQLSAGEIVEQAMRIDRLCGDAQRLTNVVFMGLGEPLANYRATMQAVRTINAGWGMGVGARRITVSTVGLPDQMRRLAEESLQITLALSLHAPTDADSLERARDDRRADRRGVVLLRADGARGDAGVHSARRRQ